MDWQGKKNKPLHPTSLRRQKGDIHHNETDENEQSEQAAGNTHYGQGKFATI
jgi:hypothetical protein